MSTIDQKGAREILSSLQDDHMERMSKWERGFVESLQEWVDGGRDLTDGQLETLEKIWVKMP